MTKASDNHTTAAAIVASVKKATGKPGKSAILCSRPAGDAGTVRAAVEAAVRAALAECRRADLESAVRASGIERGIGWLQRRVFAPYGVSRVGQLTDAGLLVAAAAAFLDPAPVA